jgi:hypothetical protein
VLNLQREYIASQFHGTQGACHGHYCVICTFLKKVSMSEKKFVFLHRSMVVFLFDFYCKNAKNK